ncbi:hypothetical protein R6Q59_011498 [Mikania micrantha]|uniref:Uncharacterized protein n=1 Tax=Mikania micrantha TaxID=192012 RepID=A0A5N6L6X6_9ASTR|nr:hypothetical protein E3N88_46223 [Mikania micrantha]
MADHPPLIDLQTTAQILHRTNVIFSTGHNLRTFLVLSFLLFSLRDSVENISQFITTSIDNDPYIESILSRSQLPPISTTSKRHRHRHHHRPNWVVLDIGFLSIEQDGRIFEYIATPKENATSLILDSFSPHMGYSKFVSDNGIRASEVVRPGVRFSYRSFKIVEKEDNVIMNSTNGSTLIDAGKTKSKKDLHQETKRLLFKIGAICASFCFMIIASIVIDIWVHGAAFVLVANDILNNQISLQETFHDGAILGSRRLFGFMITKLAIRNALTQLYGVYHFVGIKDQYSLLKIFVRLMILPFSSAPPSVKGYEEEIYLYMLTWFMLDMFMSFPFALGPWVAMVDPGLTRGEVIEEGNRLFSLRSDVAFILRSLQGLVCGDLLGLILAFIFGNKLFALMIQSFMEVYFMVALMLHTFSVKSMDDMANEIPFGQQELEALLEV